VKWLTGGGFVAAGIVGAAVVVGLSWRGLALLLAFFVTGSLLTQASGGEGGRRTARQVIANGGVAAAAALAGWWPVTAGALAAATADTWATEIGSFSPTPPRLITSGAIVSRGTSGGITLLGTMGGLAGAIGLAALALLLRPAPRGDSIRELVVVGTAGATGMFADSLLGATRQGVFECPACGGRFERAGALCHEPVRRIRGWALLDNDAVNLAATLVGAAVAALGSRLWR